jgi:NADH-quinone oxidoreductase subunit A
LLEKYAFIALFAIITLIFPFAGFVAAKILRPRKPNSVKQATYECGLETIGETWVQFRIQYYLYALVFILFDVEAVFLFPWAVSLNQLGLYALVEMFIFLGLLIAGLAYAWKKGALRWV